MPMTVPADAEQTDVDDAREYHTNNELYDRIVHIVVVYDGCCAPPQTSGRHIAQERVYDIVWHMTVPCNYIQCNAA